jgi:hypothetical protein
MKITKLILISILTISLISCKNDTKKNEIEKEDTSNKKSKVGKQLNITILLDLSDRIEPTKYPSSPEHFERDIEVVNYFTELFKKDMEQKGAFMAKGKMKVIFSPRPKDSEINNIASQLSVDLSNVKNTKEKKKIFDDITGDFKENLSKIYSKTIETKQYPGSDIWRFFKNDVVDYCIENNEDYRNILVLITDGYLYHKNSTDITNNRSAYLIPRNVESNGLRKPNWVEKIKNEDFGYITTRGDLNNLDILVLEINPSKNHKNDEDVIKAYLSKWFEEMNVNTFKLYNSDLPQYTKSKIKKFINQ